MTWSGTRQTAGAWFASTVLISALVASAAIAQTASDAPAQPESTIERFEKAAVSAERFMVVSAHPTASEVGYRLLADGGNAIDAMVAVQLMLNLVEPQSSGIGGGAFLLYWNAGEQKLYSFDGREKAPMDATPEYFVNADGTPMDWWEAVVGGRSVGVPGTLKLLDEVHARFGTKPWAELLQPTIDLATEGFEISGRLAGAIAEAQLEALDKFETTKAYFFQEDGSPKPAGTLLQNAEFAASLELIAAERSQAFYEGPIGEAIVDAVASTKDNPGIMTMEDLAGYEVVEREPVCHPYRSYRVCGMGPPTSGGLTVGQILGVLEHFDMPGIGYGAEAVHLFAEAAKLAYADRGLYIADSDFVRMPTKGLLDSAYLTHRAQLVDRTLAMETASPGNPPWREAALWAPDTQVERPGTSHFSIVDADGNAVSMTTTIETGFGSRVMAAGFLLNNELTDFSLAPEADGRPIANRVEGGKRPRSSMAPTIVFDGNGDGDGNGAPVLLVGSPGGSRIINYVAKTLVAVLDWQMDIQSAINIGHFANRNGATDLEQGTEAVELKAALEAIGHQVNLADLNSGLHGIQISDTGLVGGADPRREGLVLGD